MKTRSRITFGSVACLIAMTASAHSGGTDANGCHTVKKTGEYHCHTPKIKQAKTEARTSARGTDEVLCIADIYNCSDFATHAQAQDAYEFCLESVGKDVHRLDGDNDGHACESLN